MSGSFLVSEAFIEYSGTRAMTYKEVKEHCIMRGFITSTLH
jgi:hypothetical protein